MHFTALLVSALPILGIRAAPKALPQGTTTCTEEPAASTTATGSITFPTAAYKMLAPQSASRNASPIQYSPMQAAGQRFYFGGQTASYCPLTPDQCPPGTETAFLGLGAMDTEVPGGQRVWVAPGGLLGFTQAHSASYPAGAVLDPFMYTKEPDQTYGYITTNAFNASGFVACPTTSRLFQVYAATSDLVVPNGNASSCLSLRALLTVDYSLAPAPAAWQYI